MRKCTHCLKPKHPSEFYLKFKLKFAGQPEVRQARCKECYSSIVRAKTQLREKLRMQKRWDDLYRRTTHE